MSKCDSIVQTTVRALFSVSSLVKLVMGERMKLKGIKKKLFFFTGYYSNDDLTTKTP